MEPDYQEEVFKQNTFDSNTYGVEKEVIQSAVAVGDGGVAEATVLDGVGA